VAYEGSETKRCLGRRQVPQAKQCALSIDPRILLFSSHRKQKEANAALQEAFKLHSLKDTHIIGALKTDLYFL